MSHRANADDPKRCVLPQSAAGRAAARLQERVVDGWRASPIALKVTEPMTTPECRTAAEQRAGSEAAGALTVGLTAVDSRGSISLPCEGHVEPGGGRSLSAGPQSRSRSRGRADRIGSWPCPGDAMCNNSVLQTRPCDCVRRPDHSCYAVVRLRSVARHVKPTSVDSRTSPALPHGLPKREADKVA